MSKTVRETEIVIYAKIGDIAKLQEASKQEHHIQLETEFKNGVRNRVRHVTKPGGLDARSYFTFKVPGKEDDGLVDANSEYNAEVDNDFYMGYYSVAERMLVKNRYTFLSTNVVLNVQAGPNPSDLEVITLPSVKYEVDVYEMENGETAEYCKIDVEIDAILNHLDEHHGDIENIKVLIKVNHLPFAPEDVILSTSDKPEDKEKIAAIWETFKRKVPKAEDV